MLGSIVLFSVVISITSATFGVDVSDPVSQEAFQCLKSTLILFCLSVYILLLYHIGNGYQFAIVRVYREIGQVDSNGAQTIINARNAGIAYVDGYIYPCVGCGNPAQQVFRMRWISFSRRRVYIVLGLRYSKIS